MKVEYPIQLFQSFNKRIWNNKPFTYFVIALIICYTVMLRNYPEIYYKYLLDPIILSFAIICSIIITVYNFQLGIVLVISLISLYYPKQYKHETIDKIEPFENTTSPIEKTDKNIVDDEKKKKSKSSVKPIEEDGEDGEDREDNPDDEGSQDEEDSEDVNVEDESGDDEDQKISGIKLESLNPNYYVKSKPEEKKKKSKNNKSSNVVEKLIDVEKPKKETKSTNDPTSSFLGEVRSVISDLDTGKNKMNASNAIKKINSLMQQKHRSYIQKIINKEDEDEEEEEDSDEDFY
jgi:hypothetical protein